MADYHEALAIGIGRPIDPEWYDHFLQVAALKFEQVGGVIFTPRTRPGIQYASGPEVIKPLDLRPDDPDIETQAKAGIEQFVESSCSRGVFDENTARDKVILHPADRMLLFKLSRGIVRITVSVEDKKHPYYEEEFLTLGESSSARKELGIDGLRPIHPPTKPTPVRSAALGRVKGESLNGGHLREIGRELDPNIKFLGVGVVIL